MQHNDLALLIYDKSRRFEMLTPITDEIKAQMNGRPEAFFEIDLINGNPFRFVREVPSEEW